VFRTLCRTRKISQAIIAEICSADFITASHTITSANLNNQIFAVRAIFLIIKHKKFFLIFQTIRNILVFITQTFYTKNSLASAAFEKLVIDSLSTIVQSMALKTEYCFIRIIHF
jgi:hypothetical protein